jgi:hypothetical protein
MAVVITDCSIVTPSFPLKGCKSFRGSLPPRNSFPRVTIYTHPKYSCDTLRAGTSRDRPFTGCRTMRNEICDRAAAGSIAIKPCAGGGVPVGFFARRSRYIFPGNTSSRTRCQAVLTTCTALPDLHRTDIQTIQWIPEWHGNCSQHVSAQGRWPAPIHRPTTER